MMRHTLGVNPTPTSTSDVTRVKPPTSVGQVFALVAGFVALAAIGAAIGWALASSSNTPPNARPSTSVAVTTSASTTPPSPTPSPTPSGLVVPDFHANGVSFQDARTVLTNLGVGWVIVFNSKELSDDTVVSTSPAANKPLKRGDTVKIFVNEPAPQLDVPNVVGVACDVAGKQVHATGFTPAYPNGHSGVVLGENPAPTYQNAHWNDTIQLMCGTPQSAPPSPSPSPSLSPPDGNDPSSSPPN
jgi:hypothetical protein